MCGDVRFSGTPVTGHLGGGGIGLLHPESASNICKLISALVHFRTLVTLRRVRVRVRIGLELRLGLELGLGLG